MEKSQLLRPMARRATTIVATTAASAGCAVLLLLCFPLLLKTTSLFAAPSTEDWQPVVHFLTNSLIQWRPDPLLLSFLRESGSYVYEYTALLFVLLAATVTLRLSLTSAPALLLPTIALGLLYLLVVTAWLGFDVVIVGLLAWTAVFSLCYRSAVQTPRLATTALLAFAAWELSYSTPQLAVFAFLLTFALERSEGGTTPSGSKLNSQLISFAITLPVIVALSSLPSFPDYTYPLHTHVVASSVTPGSNGSLIWSSPNITVVHQKAVRLFFLPALAGIVFIAMSKAWRSDPRFLPLISLLCLIAVDIILSPLPDIQLISPLSSLSRVLPGLAGYSLVPAAFLSALLLMLFAIRSREQLLPAFLCLVAAIVTAVDFSPTTVGLFPHTYASATAPAAEKALAVSPLPNAAIALSSPSARLVLDEYTAAAYRHRATPFVSARGYVKAILASSTSPSLEVENLLRKDPHLRWSTGKGYQNGNEWIAVRFNEALLLSGLELHVGKYFSDYPRGLRISVAEHCTSLTANNSFSVVFEKKDWQGAIGFTSEGLPFHFPQHKGAVFFRENIRATCLLIEQIGKSRKFDWSVAKLRLAITTE